MMLGILKKVLVAADWEWIPCQFVSHEVLGDLQPKSETAAPAKAVMNAILRFLFEISLAAIAKPSGTHVFLKYNGVLFWGGLLEESLALHDLGAVVHTVLACIEEKTPRWTQGARRIYLEGDLSQCNTNSRDNVTFHLCSPFHGGGGKTDTWKEAKSLLGKELIQRGWPVRGLDDVTTSWIRSIGTNKLFGILKQPGSEKRWNALTEAAKLHGIQIEPDEPVRLKAAQKIQNAIRKRAPLNLSATGYQLVPGFFIDEGKNEAKILGTVNLQSSGVCLVEWDIALPWLQKGERLVADELAILTLFTPKLPEGLPAPTEVTFPALDVHDRKVVLRGHLWQLGERKIQMATHEQKIDMEESIVLAVTVWKDECDEENWKQACSSLVKFAFSHFDATLQEATIQVWGRSFRDLKGKSDPQTATSAQFHCRVLTSHCETILKQSGHGPVYITPKSDTNLSHPDWGMIWLKDKIELKLAASRATEHSGFARTKDRYALRVRTALLEQIAKEVRPADPPRQVIPVNLMFKIQPLPKGIVLDQVVKWASALKWNIRIIQKLGHDAVLVGSSTAPQYEHMTMNGSLVLIKPVMPAKNQKSRVSALVAGPRPPQARQNPRSPAAPIGDGIGDPWANYHPTQGGPRPAVAATQLPSTNGNVGGNNANPPRQVDAPIAAKFSALEDRLAVFETSLQEIRNEQKAVSVAVESSAKQAAATEGRVKSIEGSIQTINNQMQYAVENAIAKGLAHQEKKLDTKFQSLLEMLSKTSAAPASAPGKRSQPLHDDDEGDAHMESPAKPATKK